MSGPAKFGLICVVLFAVFPFGTAFAQSRGIPPQDHSDTILNAQPKLSDSEAERTIRQQVEARQRQEQADRVAAAEMRTIRRTVVEFDGHRLIPNYETGVCTALRGFAV